MSRSIRKNKIVPYANASEKKDKTLSNRKLRNIVKVRIKKGNETLPIIREVSNVWNFKKDGKHYWSEITKKEMFK